MNFEVFFLVIAGAIGALTKDVVIDNKLVLPKYEDGSLLLGFLGGMIIGGVVGFLVDQSIPTAFLSGYAGTQVLEALIPKEKKE